MAKKQREEGGGYNFMDTYGDMMTLLLTFFILLFSMSSVDKEKWDILVKAFSKNKDANTSQIVMIPEGDGNDIAPAVGQDTLRSPHTTDNLTPSPEEPMDMTALLKAMEAYIEQNDLSEQVKVEKQGENSIYMSFDNNIFFAGDSAVLRPASYDILSFMGDCFKSMESKILMVKINGHTAAIPNMENYAVNDWDLSSNRANRVASYFEEQKQFDPAKLMTNGYGKNHPITSNDTEEGRSQNRRVDIQILGNEFDKDNADELYDILTKTLDVDLYDDTKADDTNVTVGNTTTATDKTSSDVSTSTASGTDTGIIIDGGVPSSPIEEPTEEEVSQAMDALRSEAAAIA